MRSSLMPALIRRAFAWTGSFLLRQGAAVQCSISVGFTASLRSFRSSVAIVIDGRRYSALSAAALAAPACPRIFMSICAVMMMQMQIAMFRPELPPCVKSLSYISYRKVSYRIPCVWNGGNPDSEPGL
jgi:hypothetical protein